MNDYLREMATVTACGSMTPIELDTLTTEYRIGCMLPALATASAWKGNTHPDIFVWITNNIKNTAAPDADTWTTVFATVIGLASAEHQQGLGRRAEQVARLLFTATQHLMTTEQVWRIICWPRLPPLSVLQDLTTLATATAVDMSPTRTVWTWLWTAGWHAGYPDVAKWAHTAGHLDLLTLPTHMRTLCVFRKPFTVEAAERIPVAAMDALVRHLGEAGVRTLCLEVLGGHRSITLEWEMPERDGGCSRRITRAAAKRSAAAAVASVATVKQTATAIGSNVPLVYHAELARFYEDAPDAGVKLLWLGLAKPFIAQFEAAVKSLDEIGAKLVAVRGGVDEESYEDKNELVGAVAECAANHIRKCRYTQEMFRDAGLIL